MIFYTLKEAKIHMINAKIKIEPRVIQHLGQDLITSPEVAVTELLKNSIDAGSTKINIHIFDTFNACINSPHFMRPLPNDFPSHVSSEIADVPLCVIEDVGCGMSPIELEKGFLSIGTRSKVDKADTLGEKGIGRLSTQRLGKIVIVETVSEKTLSILRLDWNRIISGNDDVTIIDRTAGVESYTRIWIFGINLTDFLDIDNQLSLNNDEEINVNSELKTAITFLISPFTHFQALHSPKIKISMYYGTKPLIAHLDMRLLECAESTHYFRISSDEGNSELVIDYGLEIEPWYVERLHKVLTPTTQLFNQTRQKHGYYADFVQKYRERIESTLHHRLDETELIKTIVQFLERQYRKKELTTERKIALEQRAALYVKHLKAILPIESQIFTFKQNVEIGKKIILESICESKGREYELIDLKRFLSNSNGIKLYRDVFRIGFLGNKENDWIKMQQYRTKGQQFYRFDLGNTLGYVSINDPKQAIVKEISSRLDLIETNETIAFKMIINIIFNQIFYDLNRTANALVKNLLQEDGLLRLDPPKELKKKADNLRELQRKTDEIRKLTASVELMLQERTPSEDGAHVVISSKTYDSTCLALSKMVSFLNQSANAQGDAVQAMEDVEQHVLQVNADLYNNYKLMANGMITEAITHELDSVSKTSISQDADLHFKTLKNFVLDNDGISVYNNNFVPIRDSYRLVSKKLSQVADLYNFLEATFIHKGSYDVFEEEILSETVEQVKENLIKKLRVSNIQVICTTYDQKWFVPRGVLLHVFYNLFTNSAYWIDKRKRWAVSDSHYQNENSFSEFIKVESAGADAFVVSDSGTGVIRAMEDVLFEALQSGKSYSERRGMGLYIVKQLLNSFGANIELLPDRNVYGNRYRFLITYRQKE